MAKSTNRTVQQANVRTASRVAIRASNTSTGVLWRFFSNGGTRTTGGTLKVNWWQAKTLGTIFLVFEIKNVNFTTKVFLTHRGRMTQICVFNTVKLGTSASSP
jgi:hypothetical protein